MLVFRIIARLLSRFFGGLGRRTIGIFKFVGRHETALGGVVVAALLVGGVWLLLSVLNINIVVGQPQPVVKAVSPAAAAQATPAAAKVSTSNAPQVTEMFMRGQLYFNADDVWNSMDAELHNQLAKNGRDKDYFVRRFQQLKSSGIQYQSYRYIGGYTGENGQSIHFYVAQFTDGNQKVTDEPFTLVVSQGKIVAFS